MRKCAVLADGLFFVESRINKIYGKGTDTKTELLAIIADSLRTLVWFNSKDGHSGINRPESILQKLIDKHNNEKTQAFSTAEEFEAERERLRKEVTEK